MLTCCQFPENINFELLSKRNSYFFRLNSLNSMYTEGRRNPTGKQFWEPTNKPASCGFLTRVEEATLDVLLGVNSFLGQMHKTQFILSY